MRGGGVWIDRVAFTPAVDGSMRANPHAVILLDEVEKVVQVDSDNSNSVRLVRGGYVRTDEEGPGQGQRLERQAGQAGELVV